MNRWEWFHTKKMNAIQEYSDIKKRKYFVKKYIIMVQTNIIIKRCKALHAISYAKHVILHN